MSKNTDGQKFIGESRAPRVQIEYDVELYGSHRKVELPFVTGVMADLSGDNTEGLGAVEDRNFHSIDTETFDKRMQQIAPSLNYAVDNTLTPDGTLIEVDLNFRSMEDFAPASIVQQVPELSALLQARQRLKELVMYMDGKAAAEDVIAKLLNDPGFARFEDVLKGRSGGEPVVAGDSQGENA
jgi:type VI secretion system protein ImpB